jgi:hypothetical protein
MDQARHELVHGISSLIGRPTNLGLTATDHPHIKHIWVATTMNYIHVQATHIEDAWITGQKRAADRLTGLVQ